MGAAAPAVLDNASLIIFRKAVAGASTSSLSRFVARARRAAGLRGRVSVLVTSSRELRELNRRFRQKDHATDVLSFPAAPRRSRGVSKTVWPTGAEDAIVGDLAISADIASRNAARLGHRPAEELKILVLHGILHLAGFDHEHDNGEMARQEARLRRALRLPDALIERATQPVPNQVRKAGNRKGVAAGAQETGNGERGTRPGGSR